MSNKTNRDETNESLRHAVACTLIACSILILCGCTRNAPEYELITAEDERIRIQTATVNDNNVHFFTFRHNDKNINFFVRTDGSGKLHTHYDACYSCYKYKRGFQVEGDHVRCIACNLKYKLADEYWDYIGACAPIQLSSSIERDFIVIKRSDVQKGEKLF